MVNKHIKRDLLQLVIWKSKLKPPWDPTVYLLEGLKLKSLTVPNADENEE